MDTPEAIRGPNTPPPGVSPVWRGLATLALAAALVLALLTSKYSAALQHDRITDSATRAALSDRITSLEHDVTETHNQATALRQQLEVSGETVRAALSPDSRIVHFTPLGALPSASAVLAESRGNGQAVLLVTGLPPAPSGETYELWWIGPHGEAIKSTTFHLDPHGAGVAAISPPPAAAHVVAGEVTLQRAQDADKPGGTIYFRGATPP